MNNEPRLSPFMRTIALIVAFLVPLGTAPVGLQAATYYWDTNGVTATAFTATGTWSSGGASIWSTDPTGATATAAVTTNNTDDLFFSAGTNVATAGTVTISGTQAAHSITFDDNSGAITLSGGTAINIGSATAGSGFFFTNATGSANIIGTPIILNSAATAIAISNSGTALQTFNSTATITGAATTGTQTITVGTSNTGGITLAGIIGNGGAGGKVALTVNSSGAGLTTLSGANSFTGQFTVARGTLSIASINNNGGNGTLGNSSISLPVILGSSGGNTGTLQYTAASGSSDKGFALATGGTGAFDVTTALTLTGPITGSGNLSKVGAGVLTLDPSLVNASNQGVGTLSQFTGTTTINNGKIKLTSYNVAGAAYTLGAMFGLQKSVYDTTGSTAGVGLDVTPTGTATISAPVLGGLAGSVNLATAITTSYTTVTALYLNPQSGVSASYGGVITNGSGAMTLTKMGPGTQTLTGSSTYTGATTV
ncbi:MAG: autotransporter-associated beta strand repeat-containing protein, partial [Verrucomicrobia bacterium]|nr:autotransporter-associated beta strand repeat-containing protein [Verrucomicrobiota bacterium]